MAGRAWAGRHHKCQLWHWLRVALALKRKTVKFSLQSLLGLKDAHSEGSITTRFQASPNYHNRKRLFFLWPNWEQEAPNVFVCCEKELILWWSLPSMVSQHSYGKSLMVDVQGTHGFRYSGMTPGLVQRRATGFTTHSINFASSNAPCMYKRLRSQMCSEIQWNTDIPVGIPMWVVNLAGVCVVNHFMYIPVVAGISVRFTMISAIWKHVTVVTSSTGAAAKAWFKNKKAVRRRGFWVAQLMDLVPGTKYRKTT